MKVNGTLDMGKGVSNEGAVNKQSRDCKRSADPDEDVEALLPCLLFDLSDKLL
jgi:hypothetical protein